MTATRTPVFDGPKNSDICAALSRAYPGWIVEMTEGHPVATRASGGGAVALRAPALGLMGHVIAEFLHGEQIEAARLAGGAA